MRGCLLLLACLSTLSGGCATFITPPANPSDPVTIVVADYGYHTGLLLPGDYGMSEYAFGDFNYMALNRTGSANGLSALFFSSGSALARVTLDIHPTNPHLAKVLHCVHVLRMQVSRGKTAALRESLDQRFEKHRRSEIFNPMSSLFEVRDDENYSIVQNCNRVTADWLVDLGCDVEGFALTSSFRLAPQRKKAAAPALAGRR